MRAVTRIALPAAGLDFLARCAQDDVTWVNAVQRVGFQPIRNALVAMSGKYQNCMLCERNEAADVEHFKPKSKFKAATYEWLNLLYACSTCNRHKGEQFPVDAQNAPLLIDPSIEDPWHFLTFDPETGNIDPVFDLATNDFSPKGLATTSVLKLNRRRALQTAYLGTYDRLARIVMSEQSTGDEILIAKLLAADDHGLLGWCFSPQGKRQKPFDLLTDTHFQIWTQLTT